MDERYPRRLGPFVLVAPLWESSGVSVSPALRRRGPWRGPARPGASFAVERCLVEHLRPGGKHAAEVDRRFRRAGALARRLRHGNLARTLAVGRIGERLFVAHEALAGVPLGRVPARELDAETAAHVGVELTRALGYLHDFEGRRLVHHGVLPMNVHLAWDGRVRLLEGGLALSSRDLERDSEADDPGPRSFRGGARYLAPEVRAGAPGDARSDLYAVGVLLWELLAGRSHDERLGDEAHAPELRDDDDTTDRRATTPGRGGRSVPAGLYAVVAKAMSPDPMRRHSDARELGEALGEFASSRFSGRRSLKRTLARLFDVAGAERKVDEALQAARPLLAAPDPQPLEAATPAPALSHAAFPRARVLVRVGGLLALGAAALYAERRYSPAPGPAGSPVPVAVPVAMERHAPPPPAPPPPAEAPDEPAPTPSAATPAPPSPAVRARAARVPRARASSEINARALEALTAAEERFQWGDLEGAERLARGAVRNLARNPRAFYFLGVVLLARGQANEARSAFERVLELEPNHPDAAIKLRLASERAALDR